VLGLHGGVFSGPIAIREANITTTPKAIPNPTVRAPRENASIRIIAMIAIPVAEVMLTIPATVHQKSQIRSGQVVLLLMYQTKRIRNPNVKKISAFMKANQPVIAAQAGNIYMMLTNPTAISIVPQLFNKTSHTHCWHCKMRKINKANRPMANQTAATPSDTHGDENPIPKAKVIDSKNSHCKNLQNDARPE
jgi:hypothetical protein